MDVLAAVFDIKERINFSYLSESPPPPSFVCVFPKAKQVQRWSPDTVTRATKTSIFSVQGICLFSQQTSKLFTINLFFTCYTPQTVGGGVGGRGSGVTADGL